MKTEVRCYDWNFPIENFKCSDEFSIRNFICENLEEFELVRCRPVGDSHHEDDAVDGDEQGKNPSLLLPKLKKLYIRLSDFDESFCRDFLMHLENLEELDLSQGCSFQCSGCSTVGAETLQIE